ncbi:congerin-2-like isoform X6 [Anguilla rostrata]|uniref:congerin-2-like isoform X6 n=1 Tax=Anguilla rostrata TaxID=7938 RepID=UPI0030D58BDF
MSNAELKNICFKPGMEMKVTGVPKPNAARFAINVCDSKDNVALHFDARIDSAGDQRVIVLNTRKDGQWQNGVKDWNFPFDWGQQFKMTITFADNSFYINLHNGDVLEFPSRLAGKQYDSIRFHGDVTINGLFMK